MHYTTPKLILNILVITLPNSHLYSLLRFAVSFTLGRVHELTAAASSSSSIIVDWKPPKFPNGVIAGYGLTVADEEGNFVDGFDFYKKEVI